MKAPAEKLVPIRIGSASAAWIGAMVPIAFVWKGYLLTWIWEWFAVPMGLPSITIAHAIGINVLVNLLVPGAGMPKEVEWRKGDGVYTKPEWAEAPAFSFGLAALISPLPNFGIAWVASLWM